jgi:hypothetical protein
MWKYELQLLAGETTLIPFSFNFSTISSSSIKAGMYMNDTTVLLEKTKEQS